MTTRPCSAFAELAATAASQAALDALDPPFRRALP